MRWQLWVLKTCFDRPGTRFSSLEGPVPGGQHGVVGGAPGDSESCGYGGVIVSRSMTTPRSAKRAAWRESFVLGSAAEPVLCSLTARQSGYRCRRVLSRSTLGRQPGGTWAR